MSKHLGVLRAESYLGVPENVQGSLLTKESLVYIPVIFTASFLVQYPLFFKHLKTSFASSADYVSYYNLSQRPTVGIYKLIRYVINTNVNIS